MGDPLPFSANSVSRGPPYSCMSEAIAVGAGLHDVAVIGEPVDDGPRIGGGVDSRPEGSSSPTLAHLAS